MNRKKNRKADSNSRLANNRNLSFFGSFLIILIRGYQRFISPLTGPHCKYTPTCSQYAIEAVKKYGALKGMILSCKRILRCHPFAEGGYDPVP